MKISRIYAAFFSPTGGTQKITETLAETMGRQLNLEVCHLDLTLPAARQQVYSFQEEDLLLLGVPVYAGRIPNKILPDLEKCIQGSGRTPVIPVTVYGNRDYAEALRELCLLAESNGCISIAAAALVARHAFSRTLGQGRPDAEDLAQLREFAATAATAIAEAKEPMAIPLDRERPIGPYYTPLKMDGTPARFLKAKPLTKEELCNQCGLCAKACPMGSISREDCREVTGVCIKCQACVRKCPTQAKYFADPDFLSHVEMLESNYVRRKEGTFYYPLMR